MSTAFTDLKAWQKAMELVLEVYRCTRTFPKEETYGLTAQMRRAAVSVPSNIAEGRGRFSHKELCTFCSTREAHSWNWRPRSSLRMN
jgi:four helix bundle protein